MKPEKIKYGNLSFGEFYTTTKTHTYSNYDENFQLIEVPEGERLLFRSFQPHGRHEDEDLALFFWLKHRITVCLCVSEQTPILYMKHVEWEKRHDNQESESKDD